METFYFAVGVNVVNCFVSFEFKLDFNKQCFFQTELSKATIMKKRYVPI